MLTCRQFLDELSDYLDEALDVRIAAMAHAECGEKIAIRPTSRCARIEDGRDASA